MDEDEIETSRSYHHQIDGWKGKLRQAVSLLKVKRKYALEQRKLVLVDTRHQRWNEVLRIDRDNNVRSNGKEEIFARSSD